MNPISPDRVFGPVGMCIGLLTGGLIIDDQAAGIRIGILVEISA
jgi:hypothetical protein